MQFNGAALRHLKRDMGFEHPQAKWFWHKPSSSSSIFPDPLIPKGCHISAPCDLPSQGWLARGESIDILVVTFDCPWLRVIPISLETLPQVHKYHKTEI